MKYRVTCLTPTLVGDGERLSPIDYMVWKDQVNVLDQHRIFRLLSRGPRLDGYLNQLKKAEKLDFASWGGFAQNYAGRRIPFEHASSTAAWERAKAENLFIPTFASGPRGAFLPASALKGAIHTGVVCQRLKPEAMKEAASKVSPEGRGIRSASAALEDAAIGAGGSNALRLLGLSDSNPIQTSSFKIYLLRVSTLESKGGRYELGWKYAGRGGTKRPEDAIPWFAEMASPGTAFEGDWRENTYLERPEVSKALRAKDRPSVEQMVPMLNEYSRSVIRVHRQYAEWTGLTALQANMDSLLQRIDANQGNSRRFVLPIGWGAGFVSKTAMLDTKDASYRQILGQLPFYSRAIQSNLPFPKTRRIIFLNNQPVTLPGFVEVELLVT